MNARTMTPAPPMPTYVEAPWAKPAFTPPAVPDPWKNHAVARLLWTRLFANDADPDRPAWPTAQQWESFGTIVEKIDAIAEIDQQTNREPDPVKRDALTDRLFDLDADVVLFARKTGYPKHFLRNVAGNRSRINVKPQRRDGEDIASFDMRLAAWRREKSLADA